MATTTSQAKDKPTKSAKPTANVALVQTIRSAIETHLHGEFQTLLQVPRASNIILGLMLKESSFEPNAVGKPTWPSGRNVCAKFKSCQEMAPLFKQAGPQGAQYQKLAEAFRPYGLCQVMGWHHFKWTVNGGRADFFAYDSRAQQNGLVCNPGDSVADLYLKSPNAISKGVIGGLIILEHNLKFELKNTKDIGLAFQRAVADHLGRIPGTTDANGTNSKTYVAQIYTNADKLGGGWVPAMDGQHTSTFVASTDSTTVQATALNC